MQVIAYKNPQSDRVLLTELQAKQDPLQQAKAEQEVESSALKQLAKEFICKLKRPSELEGLLKTIIKVFSHIPKFTMFKR